MIEIETKPSNSRSATVVLVHGLGAKKWLMGPIERRLRAAGYRTINFGYHSFCGSLERHARKLREKFSDLPLDEPISFVGHSMGAIVVRLAIGMGPLPNLDKATYWRLNSTHSSILLRTDVVHGIERFLLTGSLNHGFSTDPAVDLEQVHQRECKLPN